ncbi:MAG: hypothetical protein M9938_07055 [Solirubrobacterales bacterium]|nr:hypothetical protein [Solirubrobacterales bacterium]
MPDSGPDDRAPDRPEVGSVEVLDPGSGLFLSLTAGGNGAVILDGEVIAASPIPAGGLSSFTAGTSLSLDTERGELEVGLESVGEPIRFSGNLTGERESCRAEVRGTLTDRGDEHRIGGTGVIHSVKRPPSSDSLRRDLTVILDEGGLLCVATAGPEASWCHGEEEAVAAISHPGGYLEFERALVSTQSDEAGRQQRATLELWPASEQVAALHGAGHSVAGCTARLPDATVNTALFRWSLDGHAGTGRYELTRPRTSEETDS